jgi:hypothetical protein
LIRAFVASREDMGLEVTKNGSKTRSFLAKVQKVRFAGLFRLLDPASTVNKPVRTIRNASRNKSIAALEVGKHFGYLLLDRSLHLDTAII